MKPVNQGELKSFYIFEIIFLVSFIDILINVFGVTGVVSSEKRTGRHDQDLMELRQVRYIFFPEVFF